MAVYLDRLAIIWGPPRIAIDPPVRVLRREIGYSWKMGWTWFPGNVNHSLTLWLNDSHTPTGLQLSCHDKDHAQLSVRAGADYLTEHDIVAWFIMAGWTYHPASKEG